MQHLTFDMRDPHGVVFPPAPVKEFCELGDQNYDLCLICLQTVQILAAKQTLSSSPLYFPVPCAFHLHLRITVRTVCLSSTCFPVRKTTDLLGLFEAGSFSPDDMTIKTITWG